MPQMTFMELIRKVLEEEQRPLSPVEIWQIAQAKGYDKSLASHGKTPWDTISAQLYVDVRDNPHSLFAKVSSRPAKFVLRSLLESQGLKALEAAARTVTPTVTPYTEGDLHPFLVYYAFHRLRAYLKTIRHQRSGKKDYAEWVHPDMVGCAFPFDDWNPTVVEVSQLLGNTAVKLYSFELKRELNFSNLREAFFQTVSNSSWAHEGYLAAAAIANESDFRSELERLSTSFGIGVIHIDVEDPDATEVILPARYKETVDWDTINKLTQLNPDFEAFLKRIKTDYTTREIRREKYDPVPSREELLSKFAYVKEPA